MGRRRSTFSYSVVPQFASSPFGIPESRVISAFPLRFVFELPEAMLSSPSAATLVFDAKLLTPTTFVSPLSLPGTP